jgi:HD-GYP domain-containing protein (c-di-GMP phosphodiesterase class II)
MTDEEVEVIRTAGRLHDIGKIGIREEVLAKQGPLTPAEYEHVKDHVIIGTQILAPLAHLHAAITCMRSHHERWDGQGYPDGLKGEEIPFGARIIAIAEIFDALTTSRPYQEKMPANFAVDRLRDLVGTAVDPGAFAGLESVIARRQTLVFLEDTTPT